MTTRTWKVYGVEGHRQRESFEKSYLYDFSTGDDVRIIEVENSDKTGTNDYSLVRITRNTAVECEEELYGQISDGIFENSRTGEIEEVKAMKKTNVEIAKMVAERGYDFQDALDGIDAGRTSEDEEMEITEEELNDIVENVCSSFDQEADYE